MKKSILFSLALVFGVMAMSAEAGPLRNLLSKLRNRSGSACSTCR